MPAKFCTVKDCYEVAVGHVRSRDHCRPHLRSEVLAHVDLVRCQVVGTTAGLRGEVCRVTDARTGESHAAPEHVWLDPEETNIPALVAAGAVKVAPEGKPAKTLKEA